MCGITLAFSKSGGREAVLSALRSMGKAQAHRGPDATGEWISEIPGVGVIGIGHQRLSIIDLSDAGRQPMVSNCGRYTLAFNGEIYNYIELAASLGHNPLLHGKGGDTAVAMQCLIEHGPSAFASFNGMWSMLFYDREERLLTISRDRMGKKPIYIYRSDDSFLIASEIKAILAASDCKFALNLDSVSKFLFQGMSNDCEETFFNGINSLPPATYATLRLSDTEGGFQVHEYWRHPVPDGAEMRSDSHAWTEELRGLLIDSVRLRLRSDVPVGVLLSGGLDSSTVLACARLFKPKDITALAVISSDIESNEEPFIDIAAKHVGCHLEKVRIDLNPVQVLQELKEVCYYHDGPVNGCSWVAHYNLMKKAGERGHTVLLSGQGSDEQLAGYSKFFYFYLKEKMRKREYGRVASTFLGSLFKGTVVWQFSFNEARRYLPSLGRRLYAGTPGGNTSGFKPVDVGMTSGFREREWADLRRFSLPMLLHSEDRMSMACSKEVRVPFLDYRLVEFLGRIPPEAKIAGGWTKHILREAFSRMLPPAIIWRRDKKGFNVPEDLWIRKDFKEEFLKTFRGNMICYDLGLLCRSGVLALYSRFEKGDYLVTCRDILRIYTLEVWLRSVAAHIGTIP